MSSKNVETRFWLGEEAGPTCKKDVKGVVVGILISMGGVVSYKVAWIHDGERKTNWFEECELCGGADSPDKCGFVRQRSTG